MNGFVCFLSFFIWLLKLKRWARSHSLWRLSKPCSYGLFIAYNWTRNPFQFLFLFYFKQIQPHRLLGIEPNDWREAKVCKKDPTQQTDKYRPVSRIFSWVILLFLIFFKFLIKKKISSCEFGFFVKGYYFLWQTLNQSSDTLLSWIWAE